MINTKNRNNGYVSALGSVPSNQSKAVHICQFYSTKEELTAVLVPYFSYGLKKNESCIWVTSKPLMAKEAENALKLAVPNLDDYLSSEQMKIVPYDQWYLKDGEFDREQVMNEWLKEEQLALRRGFTGLRVNGNFFWVERDLWGRLVEYEEAVNKAIAGRSMTAICSYFTEKCTCTELADLLKTHPRFLLTKKQQGEEKREKLRNNGCF
ncbi:MAG: MEDS domain-containing protein [Candidatus Bathyarchaeota archaeon]|nr:MEDS domain-containing protein [Candidatus Bathyarchaeota archaeon]